MFIMHSYTSYRLIVKHFFFPTVASIKNNIFHMVAMPNKAVYPQKIKLSHVPLIKPAVADVTSLGL